MHLVHILTSIKIAWLCQTSGFQWKAWRGALIISLPYPIPLFSGSLHTYSGALKPVPTQQAPAAFLSYFLHLISRIIHAHSTIAPSSLLSPFYLNSIWKYQSTESLFSSNYSSPAFFYSTNNKETTVQYIFCCVCVKSSLLLPVCYSKLEVIHTVMRFFCHSSCMVLGVAKLCLSTSSQSHCCSLLVLFKYY